MEERVIKLRHQQPSLWTGILKEDLDQLWEPWMRVADELLEDETLVDQVYEAQGRRYPQSRSRGREQTPAEVALRMLLLKHVRNWSYEVLEREVKANLVYRSFCRVGMEKVPDAKTLGKIGLALGPEVVAEMHARLVKLAQEKGVVRGRKMRTDTTVVETNIHYPTDSSLLQDGARVLTRGMKRIESQVGGLKKKVRNRMRSVTKRVIAIAYAVRHKGEEGEKKRKQQYRELLRLTRQILNDTKRVLNEVEGLGRSRRAKVEDVREQLQTMAERLRKVVQQTKGRIFGGMTQLPDKVLSLFEWYTEIIRKGKAGKPNEFGKLVQIQEAENQIVTHYDVFAERPSDRHLLAGAVESHQKRLGRVPELAAADAGYYAQDQEKAVQAMGVKHVSVPNRSTRSEQRRKLEKCRWFKKGQRWRTGSEGRISTLKRRHGLNRCRYRGWDGFQRWVGLGVMADNLIQIGRCLALRTT
jgi:transposase, IS5 family